MSTNYYWRVEQSQDCPTCSKPGHRSFTDIHVGQSAAGWRFMFQVYPDSPDLPKLPEEWKAYMKTAPGVLVNEYNEVQDIEEFWAFVEIKQKLKTSKPDWLNTIYWVDATYDAVSCEFS